MTDHPKFEPGRHLSLINGNEYLEVKWRLVWLRSEHPDAVIDTELVHYDNGEAVCKAYVKVPDGGSATGWGSEDAQSFGDFIEKAETKALGRALAALGFGTQFCTDFDFGGDQGRVVDSPVSLRGKTTARPSYDRGGGNRSPSRDLDATPKQMDLIRSLARDLHMDSTMLKDMIQERIGRPSDEMTRADASSVIDHMKELQIAKAAQSISN